MVAEESKGSARIRGIMQVFEKVELAELVRFEGELARPANRFFNRVGNFYQAIEKKVGDFDDLDVFSGGFSVRRCQVFLIPHLVHQLALMMILTT